MTAMYPHNMSATILPRRGSKKLKGRLKALSQGFENLTLDPTPRLRRLTDSIERTNTVADAWNQTGEDIRLSMKAEGPAKR